MTLAVLVRTAVDLDGEAHLGAREVDDVIADDELAAEGEAGFLGPREAAPEVLFGPRGLQAHQASALLEQCGVGGRDKTASKHADLREPARMRAERRSHAQLP